MTEKYFSTAEVAEMLGVSRIAIFKRIKTGKLKAIQVGRAYVIAKTDYLELSRAKLTKERKKESAAS